jgi:hypothetical protein
MGLSLKMKKISTSCSYSKVARFMTYDNYWDLLKACSTTPADSALARVQFNLIRQSDTMPSINYYSRLLEALRKTVVNPDVKNVIRKFGHGMASEELRREMIWSIHSSPEQALLAPQIEVALMMRLYCGREETN